MGKLVPAFQSLNMILKLAIYLIMNEEWS